MALRMYFFADGLNSENNVRLVDGRMPDGDGDGGSALQTAPECVFVLDVDESDPDNPFPGVTQYLPLPGVWIEKLKFYRDVYFDETYYAHEKAAATGMSVEEVRADWTARGIAAYQDFAAFGARFVHADGSVGISPSPYMDAAAYWRDRTAKYNAVYGTNLSAAEVAELLVNPISDYAMYGYRNGVYPVYARISSIEDAGDAYPFTDDFGVDVILWNRFNDPEEQKINAARLDINKICRASGNVLLYCFDESAGGAFSPEDRSVVRARLAYVADLLGLQFREASDPAAAFLRITNRMPDPDRPGVTGASFCYAGEQTAEIALSLDILKNGLVANHADAIDIGSTFLHELGHLLGLKHPFMSGEPYRWIESPSYAGGGTMEYTVMAYDDEEHGGVRDWYYGTEAALYYSPYDVAALQYIYGRDGFNGAEGITCAGRPAVFYAGACREIYNYMEGDVVSIDYGQLESIRRSGSDVALLLKDGRTLTIHDALDRRILIREFGAVETPYEVFNFNGHSYALFSNCRTWEEARDYAALLGGHLATIGGNLENAALYRFVRKQGLQDAYFGLTDRDAEGAWKWVTGESLSYLNWHAGEPNGENSSEDYAMFYWKFSDGTWNDGRFIQNSPFICEWDKGIAFDHFFTAGRMQGRTVAAGETLHMLAGGEAFSFSVLNGAGMEVDAGASAFSASVSSGGSLAVAGYAEETAVFSGGTQTVLSGGLASGCSVFGASAAQIVMAGGSAADTHVSGLSARQLVQADGSASGAVVHLDARQHAYGAVFGTTVESGGHLDVESGGLASGVSVLAGARLHLKPGASIFDAVMASGAGLYVSVYAGCGTQLSGTGPDGRSFSLQNGRAESLYAGRGGISAGAGAQIIGACIGSRGMLQAESGAFVSGLELLEGGSAFVKSGASDFGAAVRGFMRIAGGAAGASETVFSGGSLVAAGFPGASAATGAVSGARISSGGTLAVYRFGSAFGAAVCAGGTMAVSAEGFASGAAVFSGGSQTVLGGSAFGTILYSGGELHVSAANGQPCLVSGAAVHSGARLIVSGGGSSAVQDASVSGAAVSAGGRLLAYAPVCEASAAGKGALLQTLSGGTALLASLADGGTERVYAHGLSVAAAVGSGGSQIVSAGGAASGTLVAAGGVQTAASKGAVWHAFVSGGSQSVLAGGSSVSASLAAKGTLSVRGMASVPSIGSGCTARILSGGRMAGGSVLGTLIVSSGGSAVSASVSAGGLLRAMSGALAAAAAVKKGGSMLLSSGAMLSGKNSIAGGRASGAASLLSGAQLFAGAGTDMGGLVLDASDGGTLVLTGAGVSLGSLHAGPAARLVCNLSNQTPGASMLSLAAQGESFGGIVSAVVGRAQKTGSYALADGLMQAAASCSVVLGGTLLGTASQDAALKADGMIYSAYAEGGSLMLAASAAAGWMKHGNANGNALAGSPDGDVFWGGSGGNDSIAGNGGRDCAVWGTENWGRDSVAETSGTMTLVFSGLARPDVVQKLSGATMTVAKRSDSSQRIAVSGWNAETHNIVFAASGSMNGFSAWAAAASPSLAQAKAARQDVWRTAGLAQA